MPWEDFFKLVELSGFTMNRYEKLDAGIKFYVKKIENGIIDANMILSNIDLDLLIGRSNAEYHSPKGGLFTIQWDINVTVYARTFGIATQKKMNTAEY